MYTVNKTFGSFPTAQEMNIVPESIHAVMKEREEEYLSFEGAKEVVKRLIALYPGSQWDIKEIPKK